MQKVTEIIWDDELYMRKGGKFERLDRDTRAEQLSPQHLSREGRWQIPDRAQIGEMRRRERSGRVVSGIHN